MKKLTIRFKKLTSDAAIPSKGSEFAAGFDMRCTGIMRTQNYIEYSTGIAMEIPEGYVGLLFPRSSNSKKDLLLCNSVGVIDSDYRGEIKFRFKEIIREVYNEGENFAELIARNVYQVGDAVGQIIIMPYPEVTYEETEELSDTTRGTGGFGSTGK